MGSKRRSRGPEPAGSDQEGGRDRWEERRERFTDVRRDGGQRRRGLRPSTVIALGGVVLAVVIMAATLARPGGSASAEVLQQVPATTGAVENGQVAVSIDEIKAKKIIFWDYKKSNGKTTPLMAFAAPSGAVKVAVRMCEPCNGLSFHLEGNHMVCNTCGTRWDLESLKGVSGGCQEYPPDVLPSAQAGGKLVVDEATVANWTPRP